MRAFLWTTLGLAAFLLSGDLGVGEDRAPERPPLGKRPIPSVPSQRLINGKISRVFRQKNLRFIAECYGEGSRLSQIGLLLSVDESSLLLRADGDGRFHRVQFSDLFQGDERGGFQAVIARKVGSDLDPLVSWLVLFSSRKDSPMPLRALKMQYGAGRPVERKPTEARPAIPPPYMIVGGTILHHQKTQGVRFQADCSIPGRRDSQEKRLFKVEESSLLLRADGDGRFHKVAFSDLFQGDEREGFQAVVSRKVDSDQDHLVSWLVLSPSAKDRSRSHPGITKRG